MFFVFYRDDYDDVGLASFNTEEEALSSIEERIKRNKTALSNYRLIRGQELSLKAKEYATLIEIGR